MRPDPLRLSLLLGLVWFVCTVTSLTVSANGPAYTDPEKADADFARQGEYSGEVGEGDAKTKVGVQVIALGDGKFRAVSYIGGLPGDGWNGEKRSSDGELVDGVVIFDDEAGRGEIRDGKLHVSAKKAGVSGTLAKIHRKSPTLGAQPPEGAVVLFDGSNADNWQGGRVGDDGLLMPGCTSKDKFGSHRVHVEFQLPYQPQDRGQARGNSGLYLQGRYEVQMLDSFGLDGKDNECGGVYSVKEPDVNMCLPPLSWQTYDVDYTAARFDSDGNLLANPRMTVRHNGVVIHENLELPGDRSTTAAPVKPGPEPGPVYLQNHGNPVRYRNIWVVPK